MVRISILYPNKAGARFDFGYYTETHMPMSIRLLSAHEGFRGVTVVEGFSGATPGSPAPFIAMCSFDFESVKDFLCAFTPHAEVLQNDIAKYTDIAPVIQFCEVLISIDAKVDNKIAEAEHVSVQSTHERSFDKARAFAFMKNTSVMRNAPSFS